MAFLLANNGPTQGQRIKLSAPKSVMGRHPDCDIVVDVGAVSRHHAHIVREGPNFFIEDLKSRNGTYLNDERVENRTLLNDGDTLRVCEVAFTFFHEPSAVQRTGHRSGNPNRAVDSSGFPVVMIDDESTNVGSTIMSKVDMSGSSGMTAIAASPEMKLNALLSITQSLGRALALDDVLPQVLNSLFKIFLQADRGLIVLRQADGSLAPRWSKVRREDTANDTIRISKTIINQVMSTKEAILSADAANDERFDMSQSIADFRIRSMMCAPLIDSDGKSFGVLQIDTLDQRNRFEEDDLEVLVAIAAQAAVAIDNARLHDNALLQRSLERDLALAHQVQRGFLPETAPEMVGYAFFDFYQPANHVGGDYFDYVPLPDGRLAILVADVVGHGVAAALLMAKLSAEARFNLVAETNPAKSLSLLNRAICQLPFEDRFITMIMMVLDPTTGRAELANAGHMCPILRRRKGGMSEPGNEFVGIPLGIVDDFEYQPVTFDLQSGDLVMIYTDGVNESMDSSEHFYGIDRIRRQISQTASAKPDMLGQFIVDDIRRFMGDAPQSDDMCFVLVSRD